MKNWVLAVGGLAVAGLGSLFVLRAPEPSRSRLARFRPACPEVVEPVEMPPSVPAPRQVGLVQEPDVAVPPGRTQDDPRLLRAWLLALSDGELRSLVRTPELDRHVCTVIRGLQDPRTGDVQIELFLQEINGRILAVQGLAETKGE